MKLSYMIGLVFLNFLGCTSGSFENPSIYKGDVFLNTQSEVEKFGKIGWTHIAGRLTIGK
jgi:hypothetical protein